MDSEEATTSDGRTERDSPLHGIRNALGRRTYLKAIGAYGAGRTMLGISGRVTAAEYTTYEVDAGETFERDVESGGTFENALIDVSAEDAGFNITAEGSDWTIRNVGISGTNGSEAAGSAFALQVERGADGRFENVYIGDGAIDGGNAGIFVPTAHAGTLTVQRCHVAGWPDNGIYASAPGRDERDGQEGVVRVVDSYAYNNNIAGFRLGTDGSSVERSVVHVEGDVPDNAAGKENARGIWVKEGGTVDVERCDVLLAHPDGTTCVIESDNDSSGLARVIDSSVATRTDAERFRGDVTTEDVDDDPDVTPPTAVPDSAEAAARGVGSNTEDTDGGSDGTDSEKTGDESNASDGSDEDDGSSESDGSSEGDGSDGNDNGTNGAEGSVVFAGGNSDDGEFLDYTLATSGDLTGRSSVEDGESATGGRAEGATGGSRDAFAFAGAIESLDATLTGNGGQRRASVTITEGGEKSRIRFAGGNNAEHLEYELATTGSVTATSSVEERSGVSGNSARGATGGAADELRFTGDLLSLRAALPPDAGRFLVRVETER
jgi:hypothetical protein